MFATIYQGLLNFSDWYWGWPILLILVIGGAYLTIFGIKGIQFTELGHIMASTTKKIFSKDEREDRKKGATSVQVVLQAMGGTIGTGNVVGVGTAIAVGGPGALFWMWVCGFLAMAVKYSEITLSLKYREKLPGMEGYRGGPYMYIKKAIGPFAAGLFGTLMIVRACTMGASHMKAVVDALGSLNVPAFAAAAFVLVTVILQLIIGFNKSLKISDILIPGMTILYILLAIVVVIMNISHIGEAFALIFKGAFTAQGAIGGFAGATFATAMQTGLKRGVFSNDAGCGSSSIVQSQAEIVRHPAEQGTMSIFETFVDTIIVCSLTGFMVIFTGAYTSGSSGSAVVVEAAQGCVGGVGKWIVLFSVFLFAYSSMTTIANSMKAQCMTYYNNTISYKISLPIYIATLTLGAVYPTIKQAFAITDLFNGICLTINMIAIFALTKDLRATTTDYLEKYGRKARKAAKEAAKKQ